MTVENSELNTSDALPSSNTSLSGGSGNGNNLLLADLARGYTQPDPPAPVPSWLPQNVDDGENYIGDPLNRGGFLTRPEGWER